MAKWEDWYWEQYPVEQKGGEFDLADKYTTQLGEADISRKKKADWETKFIDELYNTDNGQTIIDGKNQKLTLEKWTNTRYDDQGAIQLESVKATWGLDLRRVYGEDLEIGSTEHYEALTRGKVDWKSYDKDENYIKAFKQMKKDNKDWSDYGSPSSITFLRSAQYTDRQKVQFIRDAATHLGPQEETDDDWDIPDDWDNKYEPKYHHEGEKKGQPIDPNAVQPYEAKPLFDPASADIQKRIVGADGKRLTIRKDISTPSETGSKRDVAAAAKSAGIALKNIKPIRPSNVPVSWGPIK